jgi:hypothetical protein
MKFSPLIVELLEFTLISSCNFFELLFSSIYDLNTKFRKIEKKIQERTFRFIYEDYNSSYKCLLEKSKVHSLKIRILKICKTGILTRK